MKAQREFPELLENEGSKINSAKKLYEKIGLDETHWSRWYKKNIINNKFFKENKDWKVLATMATTEKGGQVGQDFLLSIDMAKHLALMGRTKQAHNIRSYFILMEKAIKKNIDWYNTRHPEIEGYNVMTSALEKQYMDTHNGKKPNDYLYSNNADMLNLVLFGYKSKKMKSLLGEGAEYVDSLRDNLQLEANRAFYELQILNTSLVINNLDYHTRKTIIQNTCKSKYMDLRVNVVKEWHEELKAA